MSPSVKTKHRTYTPKFPNEKLQWLIRALAHEDARELARELLRAQNEIQRIKKETP